MKPSTGDFQRFCESYWLASLYDWNGVRPALAKAVEQAAIFGGRHKFGVPRGSGSTSLLIAAADWITHLTEKPVEIVGRDRNACDAILGSLRVQFSIYSYIQYRGALSQVSAFPWRRYTEKKNPNAIVLIDNGVMPDSGTAEQISAFFASLKADQAIAFVTTGEYGLPAEEIIQDGWTYSEIGADESDAPTIIEARQ